MLFVLLFTVLIIFMLISLVYILPGLPNNCPRKLHPWLLQREQLLVRAKRLLLIDRRMLLMLWGVWYVFICSIRKSVIQELCK